MNKKLTSWILLIICNMMWSLQFTCIKLVQDQVSSYFTVWGPMIIATLMLSPFAIRDFKKSKKSIKDLLIFGQLAILGAFPSQVLMTMGTQYSLASNASIITLSLPVFSILFAFFMLKEKMNIARWISIIVALLGVILISTGDIKQLNFGSNYAIGNILIFIAIIANSYYNVGCKKISDRYTALELVFYVYVFVIILLTPFVLYYNGDVFSKIPSFTLQTWSGLALLTFFQNFLSMILFFKALKSLEAIQVAISNYLIPLFGLPIAAFWLGEKLSSQAIFGGILILISTLLISIVDYKINKQSKEIIVKQHGK